jgi:hypothetical protein
MQPHKIVSREQWIGGDGRLLPLESRLTHSLISRRRRCAPSPLVFSGDGRMLMEVVS